MSNNIKPFITRAALTLALAMLTAATGWAQTTESVTYIDADGTEKTVTATVLTGDMDNLGTDGQTTWYVVNGEVNDFFVSGLSIHGNVNIILADGCSFQVPGSSSWTSDAGFTGTGNLTFYGQTAGTGTVSPRSDAPFINVLNGDVTLCSGNIDISNNTHDAISLTGTFTVLGGSVSVKTAGGNGVYRQTAIKAGAVDIRGGSVTASGPNAIEATTVNISGGTVKAYTNGGDAGEEEYGFAIMCNTFNFSGGNVKAGYKYIYDEQTRVGIQASNINLSWTSPTDRILSEKGNDNTISYYGTVTIAQGKPFKVGSTTYMGTLTNEQIAALANQTLEPDLSLAATGDGSAAHPYYINATETWNDFCDALQDYDTWNRFSGKTVKLGTNITVTRMAGSGDNPFCGNFDGGGNTLTFTATAADNYCAPFVGVKGGTTADDATTIGNLNVVTTITANDYRHMAGLIALQWGHVNVSGCNATVNISSTVGDSNPHDLYPAALVSQASSSDGGTLTVSGCTATGTISTDGKYAAGLVGIVQGTATITDCISSVTINSSTSGDGTHSGCVAVSYPGSTTIEGCLFNGKLLTVGTTDTKNCGGFVGWRTTGTVTISNSLYAPADLNDGETEVKFDETEQHPTATFVRNGSAGTNCYYTRTLGTAQGKAPRTVAPAADVTIEAVALSGDETHYAVSGITAYSGGGLQLGETLYYGSGNQLSLTLSNSATGAPQGYQYTYVASAGTLSGTENPYTLTMPDADVTISPALRSTNSAVPVSYVDASGNTRTHDAIALDGHETVDEDGDVCLAAGWYFVGKDISYTATLTFGGDVHLILKDGCEMNVGTSSTYGINSEDITIYGQTLGTGQLSVTSTANDGIHSYDDITINGGKVTATAPNGIGIYAQYGTVAINGGNVEATGGNGIIGQYGIILGWNKPTDRITASSYYGTVKVADGKKLHNGTGFLGGTLSDPAADVNGKTLRPAATATYTTANGTAAEPVDAIVLDGNDTSLPAGNYLATGTLNYTHGITLTGDVTLILADNCHMNVGTSGGRLGNNGIDYSNNATLTITSQSLGSDMGALSVYTTGTNKYGINAKALTINGGNITADTDGYAAIALGAINDLTINGGIVTATATDADALVAIRNFNYNGGTVTATAADGYAIYADGNYTFSWRTPADRITIGATGLYAPAAKTATFTRLFKDAANPANYYGATLTGTQLNALKNVTLTGTDAISLANDASNSDIITNANNITDLTVTLQGRTLYKDGAWNTLCLPFDVTLNGSPLEGAIAKTLVGAEMSGEDLSLTFGEAVTTLEAGVPYIIKWDGDGTNNIVEPVFTDVTIDNSAEAQAKQTVTVLGGDVKFVGYYDALRLDPVNGSDDFAASIVPSIYYMTSQNKLKHTGVARTLLACRAYFQFSDDAAARQITLNFGDDETTGISTTNFTNYTNSEDGWYTVDGVKLGKQPTRKGLYIHNGRKVVIK